MINDGDKVIRDHMDLMETGAENIVFDKEAAWGRLHERMTQKPVTRTFPLRWAAAAAILLLIASIIALVKQPEEKNVVTTINQTAPASLFQNKTTSPQHVEEAVRSVTTAPVYKIATKNEPQENIIVTPALQPIVVIEPDNGPIAIEEKKEVATAPKMKVLHINDLAETERVERMEYNTRYATGRSSFFLFKTTSQTGLLEDNDNTGYQTHRLFKPRFSQN